jgi:sortase A
MTGRIRNVKILEYCLLASGLILLTIFAGVLVYRSVSSRHALREFDKARTAEAPVAQAPVRPQEKAELVVSEKLDFRLWSKHAVRARRESLEIHKGSPIAALSIEKLKMRAAVFEGTDELALNRGLGWITGTARPGEAGNVGIAGHRDSFFRGLKDISIGDRIELTTLRGTAVYTVDQFEIVTPGDVSVLRTRGAPSLTLVTCYPFYFIGHAPQRFILHATLNKQSVSGG